MFLSMYVTKLSGLSIGRSFLFLHTLIIFGDLKNEDKSV